MNIRKLNVNGVDFGVQADGAVSPRTIGFFAAHNINIQRIDGKITLLGEWNIAQSEIDAFNLQKRVEDEAKHSESKQAGNSVRR